VYSTTQDKIVEIKNNNLSLFNIDSLFQKEFRLRTMDQWDYDLFNEKMGNMTEYGVVLGRPNSGKSEVANQLDAAFGFVLIDMKAVTEQIKASLAGEDGEAFEGDIPIGDVEKKVCETIEAAKSKGDRIKFLFDGFTHPTIDAFLEFIAQFGNPKFILQLSATDKYLKQRWSKKNDDADFPEEGEAVDQFNAEGDADTSCKATITSKFTGKNARVELLNLDTSNELS